MIPVFRVKISQRNHDGVTILRDVKCECAVKTLRFLSSHYKYPPTSRKQYHTKRERHNNNGTQEVMHDLRKNQSGDDLE